MLWLCLFYPPGFILNSKLFLSTLQHNPLVKLNFFDLKIVSSTNILTELSRAYNILINFFVPQYFVDWILISANIFLSIILHYPWSQKIKSWQNNIFFHEGKWRVDRKISWFTQENEKLTGKYLNSLKKMRSWRTNICIL